MRATLRTTFTRGSVPTSTTVHARRGRAHDELGHRARARAASGARPGRPGAALGIARRLAARDRGRRAPRAGALAPRRAARDPARRADRQRDARQRGTDRCGRARSRDGADARAARPRRLVRADGAEHAPVLGLGDVRADHHRGCRSRALRRADRRGRTVVLDARLRRGCRFARADGACLRRAPLHPPLRGVRRARVARVPDLVVALRGRPLRTLARGARGRPHALDRDGPRDRDHRFVGAADPRLHALLARPSARRGGAPGSATSSRRPGCSCSACCSC